MLGDRYSNINDSLVICPRVPRPGWFPSCARDVSPGFAVDFSMSPQAKTIHGGDAFAGLTFIHPTQDKAPDAKRVRPRRGLRFWEVLKRLARWCPSRTRKEEPFRWPLADVSLNHSRRKEEDNPSRDSTTKKGNAFPFIALEDGTPMLHNEVLKLGLVRFKGAPARRRLETWTVHGGDTFASLSSRRRPQHKAKREQASIGALSAAAANLSPE